MSPEFYCLNLEADGDGNVIGSCPDLPEVRVRARSRDECLRKAKRVVSDAIEFRFEMFRDIPAPTTRGHADVTLRRATALKLRLLWAIRQPGSA